MSTTAAAPVPVTHLGAGFIEIENGLYENNQGYDLTIRITNASGQAVDTSSLSPAEQEAIRELAASSIKGVVQAAPRTATTGTAATPPPPQTFSIVRTLDGTCGVVDRRVATDRYAYRGEGFTRGTVETRSDLNPASVYTTLHRPLTSTTTVKDGMETIALIVSNAATRTLRTSSLSPPSTHTTTPLAGEELRRQLEAMLREQQTRVLEEQRRRTGGTTDTPAVTPAPVRTIATDDRPLSTPVPVDEQQAQLLAQLRRFEDPTAVTTAVTSVLHREADEKTESVVTDDDFQSIIDQTEPQDDKTVATPALTQLQRLGTFEQPVTTSGTSRLAMGAFVVMAFLAICYQMMSRFSA